MSLLYKIKYFVEYYSTLLIFIIINGYLFCEAKCDAGDTLMVQHGEFGDTKTKEVLNIIAIKQSRIKEIMVVKTEIYTENDKIKNITKSMICERGPDKYYRKDHSDHKQLGSMEFIECIDGEYEWDVFIESADMIKRRSQSWEKAKIDKEKIINMIQECSKISVHIQNLKPFRELGIIKTYLEEKIYYRYPFIIDAPKNINFQNETADEYIFTGFISDPNNAWRCKYLFDKENGICIRKEYVFKNDAKRIVTLDNITINPPQGISDSYFKYQIPSGAITVDTTTATLRSYLKKISKRERK